MKQISKVQYITTSAKNTEEACKGGIDWVQLRLKNVHFDEYKAIAIEVQSVCKQYNAKLIINDNVEVAMAIHADGVHLGNEDMSHSEARKLLGDDCIIGGSTNLLEDIVRLSQGPADYLGLGPFRFTATKQKLNPILGLEGYRLIFNQLKNISSPVPPLIAIGGIEQRDILDLLAAGFYGFAVSASISNNAEPALAAAGFMELCNKDYTLIDHKI